MKRLLFYVAIVLGLSILRSPYTHAESNPALCGQDANAQVQAFVQIPSAQPDVYVRALLKEDQGPATLYFQPLSTTGSSSCFTLGTVSLSSDWQKIGTAPAGVLNQPGSLILTLPASAPGIGSGGPQTIFASSKPPCLISQICAYTYKGQIFNLSPKKISTSSDLLTVGVLSDPIGSAIKQIIYSVDGVQAYSSKELMPFNMRYVSGGDHSLERTVIFSNGESISDKQVVKHGNFGQLNYYFTALYQRYSSLVVLLGTAAAVLLVWSCFIGIARLIYKRRQWKLQHIAQGSSGFDASKAGAKPQEYFNDSILETISRHKKSFIILACSLLGLYVGFSFVLSVFTVDGVSMETTLHNTTKHPLYILPAKWGELTGSGYTPKRGTIVVIKKDENNLFAASVQEKSYVVKRIIGIPNERVVVKDNSITIYNKQYPEGFSPDEQYKWTDIGKNNYFKIDITLKQGEVFVVGDHREESVDSRFYGPVSTTQIIGQVLLR